MKKFVIAAALALGAVAAAAQAAPISVAYSYTSTGHSDTPPDNTFKVTGTFTGVDANHDGTLSFGELSTWNIFLEEFDLGERYELEDLNDFGDFDYRNNVWTPNALTFDRQTRGAYLTFNDWQFNFVRAEMAGPFITTVQDASDAVPEPASLALMGISLLALGAVRRRRASR